MIVTSEKIYDAREEANGLEERYLRERDWQYDSNYADHCWRWSKVIRGRLHTVSREQAVKIQMGLDPETPV